MTRRAARTAAITDFTNGAALDALRVHALFASASLPLGAMIGADNVRIDYLSVGPDGTLAPVAGGPGCPQQNLVSCSLDPHGPSCIRMVRARLCVAGGSECSPLPYSALVPLVDQLFDAAGTSLTLPTASTIVPAASLGRRPGMAACP